MKKQLLLFVLTLLPMMASAFTGEVEIDGINYFIKTGGQVAEVRAKNPKYSGDVNIPATVEYEGVTCNVILIANSAFFDCSTLTSVTIPSSVTKIDGSAFYGCTGMTAVHILDLAAWCNISFGDNPLTYAHHLYLNGAELKDIVIPNNVTSISGYAFRGCTGLTSVIMSSSVTSIGDEAFKNCTSLTSVTIPNSVTSTGWGAFSGCISLTSITIPNSVTSIDGTFEGCSSLTSITIPNSVTRIGNKAFIGCTSLTSVSIPNSVTLIEDYAFYGCTSLTSIVIGNGVTKIGSGWDGNGRSFANCPDLSHVYCHAVNVPFAYGNVFDGSYPQYATLHVPEESLDAYRDWSPWNYFGTIVGLSGGGSGTNKCERPTISYQSGKLVFSSATSGATFHSSITDADIGSFDSNEVQLTLTYNISVYATKSGMENSDVAQATLCWIDKEPTINTDISNAIEFSATPILIQSDGGLLTIQGADDGTPISIYTSAGVQTGSAVSKAGTASIPISLRSGSIAIVKIGSKSVKVEIK